MARLDPEVAAATILLSPVRGILAAIRRQMRRRRHIVAQREKTHGAFHERARVEQNIKGAFRDSRNWAALSDARKSALEMIAVKASRILSGDPDHLDSWRDLGGYADCGGGA